MATETLLDAPPAGEGQTFPNQGIDSQPPTIKAFDIADPLVNVDQPNLIATAPTSNYSGVDANRISGISPTITSGLFGMRSKDIAKREVGDLDFDPNVKTIVTDPSAPIDNKIKALQSYEAESAKTIGDTEVGSRYKESAAGSLDRDIITGKSELWLAYRDAKLMEDFPTYKEREAFTEAAKTGRDNPDAYQDPAHKKHISDLVAVHDKLFGNNTQAWTANAQDSSGHEVANFTVKPSPDGEAHAFLRMRGPLAAVPPTAGQSLFESVAGPLAAMSQASRNIEMASGQPLPSAAKEDKGIDNFNATIKFKMPTADDVKSEQTKIETQLAEIDKKIISAKATQDANNASPSSHGMFAGEAAADSVMASAGTQIAIDDLNAQKKNLLSRQDNLNNQGVRALANERVADAIRNDPKLLAQIPDKGKLNQLFTGFVDTMVVQPAVLGEELGNPFQKGALQTAADLHQLQGEMGVGGEQSKFRGWTRDTLTNAIIDSTPGSVVALLTGGAGRMLPVSEALGTVIGLNIGRATMSAEVYAQSIAQSEQIAHQMELSGDTAGAKEIRGNMRWSGLGMGTLEWLGEAAMPWDEMAILKKWNGGPANWARRAGVSGLTNFAEEFATQAGQGLLNPYTTGQPMDNPVGEQSWIAGAAGFVNGIVTNLAFAPFNQAGMTKEERLKAAMDFAQKMSEDAGVNPHDITPENTDISSPVVTNKDGETVINIRHMVIPDGGKNYVIADPAWRQRAFQAGVTAEFPDEQKAKEFSATMHQRIVEAEYLKATEGTKATPDEIQTNLDLARNVIKVAAIGEGRSSNDIWARLGYGQVAEIIRNANASNPPAGTEQASPAGPATASAQAIENTLTGEERIRQSAVGGKLLADRLRTQEQAGQEASAMTAAWEKRRAHALAMQDQEPAYVSDAQGHPAVTTVLTALDAYDAAKTDEERLQVLDDVKLATVAAAERIAENTIAKIEADESLNEEEKKAMSEKWWKFAEDIKAVRVAAPESSFVKQEAPAPETQPPPTNGKEEEKGQTLLDPQQEAPTARPTRHRVFDSPPAIRVSDGPTVLPAKNTESAYRVTGQSQIDDMLNTGEVRAKEGKMRGGRTGETQWSKGHENAGYNAETNDGRYVIETPVAGLNDRQGGLPLGEVTRVWKAENGKWVDVTESIKEKSKQEAPAPATADQTAASTEAVNASPESSPTAQAPEASPSAPVGTPSIPATTENATPAPPTQEAKLQAGRKAIKEQDAKREAIKGKQPNVGDNVNFKEEGTTYTGKYLGPSKDARFSRVEVKGKVFEPPNSNVAKYTPGVTLFQGEQGDGASPKGVTNILGQKTKSGGTLGSVQTLFTPEADSSTIIHEFIHSMALLETPIAGGGTRSLLESVLGEDRASSLYGWAMRGTENLDPAEGWRVMHERIAEGFEKWLLEGKMPLDAYNKPELVNAFDAIRNGMKNIVDGMLNPDLRYSYINPKSSLPSDVQKAYQQLFFLLENPSTHAPSQSKSPAQSMEDAAREGMNALYPYTTVTDKGVRIPATPLQAALALNLDPAGEGVLTSQLVLDAVEIGKKNAERANAGFSLFQTTRAAGALPFDQAKELLDVAMPITLAAAAKNNNQMVDFADWMQAMKEAKTPILNELTPGQREALYHAAALNIPSGLSIMARQRIDDAIVAAEGMEGLTVEQVNEAVAPAIAAMSPKMQKTANAIINRATTDAERKKALTSVMKVVRADARAKWAEASQNFKSLLRGYLAGNKNVDLVKDIISGINSVIRPVLKDADVSGSTKKAIAQTIMFVDKAFRGKADMTDISRQMLLHLQAIRADKARAAQTAFIKGAKVGEKYGAKRFEARQKAIIDVVSRELKTVASITPAQADRVMKMLRGATSDKQMNKAVWRALLLFQDQRVRDAHAELEARKEAIKANLKAGKFGDISGQVAEFNNFDVESIPSHFFAQYSDIAARLSSRDSVIDLNGVKNQVESMSRQLNDWLEANPQENEVRSQPLSNGFEEAMERLDAETALQDAMDGRKASSFMARQMEMGKTKKQAEMAMRMIEHGLVFRAFEEADPSTFSMFSTKELKAIAIAFQNYNEGIRTPYIYRQSKRLSEEILAKKMLPMLMHGVRQFLHLSQDTNLGVEASDLSAGGTLKQYIRRIMGFDQVLGTKPGRGSAPNEKTIKKQLDSHDQLRVDALLGTMNWMNENIVIPLQQAQGDGLLLRSELFHAKDEHGKTVTDYQRDLQGAENSPPWMEKLLDLGMISDAVKNIPFLQRIAHKREARREMHSRIMGIYMIQRQREANNMPGINYADFVKAGAIGRNPSKFAVNEHARQLSAIEAIKAGLAATWSDRLRKSREGMAEGSKEADLAAMNSANIYELLPEPARRAIKLADHVFSLTGEMTYGLNMFEREKPLPMPLKYFPIHAMADRIAISDKVASYKAGQNERASASSMRADARHARTDENLKFQNADFFGVFTDAVHEAAADSAMTPPVKVMNGAMTKMAKSGLFAATAGNVVTGLQNSMLEYAARYSHAIANNEAVTRSILGVATSMVHRMFLPKIIRPIIEGIQNGIAIAVSSHFKDYRRGTSEYSIMGRDKFWDRVMIEQRAPSAFRGATEATVGLMHSLTDSLDFRSEGDHVPGAWEEFLVDAQHVPLAERGLARLQSHRLAQGVKAASDLTVTLGEKMYIRQLWTGAYVNSLEKQTGTPFARENMSTYTAEQRQAALAAAEVAVAKILAPSARGATRQAGQIPLDGDQLKTIKQNIFYALTSFSGALSSTARLGIKDVMSNRSTQADRVAGLRDAAAVVASGVVGNTLQGIYMTTMPALALYIAMALRGDDKDEEDSPQFQKLRRFVERMNPFDGGLGDTGQFWLHRLMAGAFQARFGGANSIVRFAAATGAEVLNALAVKALREKPYDIYNDNFTMEATPGATAAVLDAGLSIFGSSDPELRRAWQNTNMTDGIKLFSPISAIFQWLGETTKDLQTIGSGLRGEQDYGGAMLDLVAQIAIPLQLFPLSRDITLATKTARDMTSPDYTTYMKNLNLKEAKRLGRDMFYEPGQKPAIIEKLNKLSPPERAAALKENMKLESFRNAYTVPDKPELTAELKKHLGDIRDAPESKIADVIYGAYYAMKKKGMENEMIARLLYLMHRPEWGSHFTVPNEAGLAPAQALQEKEMQERNDAPIWRQLYSR